jgi:hypothetical protein
VTVGGRDVNVGAGETSREAGDGMDGVGVSIATGDWQADNTNNSSKLS